MLETVAPGVLQPQQAAIQDNAWLFDLVPDVDTTAEGCIKLSALILSALARLGVSSPTQQTVLAFCNRLVLGSVAS
jgi:hypothetical protein